MCGVYGGTRAHAWRSEDCFVESVLAFYLYMGHRNRTRVTGFEQGALLPAQPSHRLPNRLLTTWFLPIYHSDPFSVPEANPGNHIPTGTLDLGLTPPPPGSLNVSQARRPCMCFLWLLSMRLFKFPWDIWPIESHGQGQRQVKCHYICPRWKSKAIKRRTRNQPRFKFSDTLPLSNHGNLVTLPNLSTPCFLILRTEMIMMLT